MDIEISQRYASGHKTWVDTNGTILVSAGGGDGRETVLRISFTDTAAALEMAQQVVWCADYLLNGRSK